MAFTTTTLNGAVAIDQNTVTLTSATGVAAGSFLRIDDEILEVASDYVSGTSVGVLRGREGTATQAHVTGANVTAGLGTDFASAHPAVSVSYPVAAKGVALISYAVAGAIALPLAGNHAIAVLNGTGVLAMTLANPTKDMDGCKIIIGGNGKAAHTVTYTAGLGNVGATADVITFSATQAQAFELIALNGFWNGLGTVAGVATVAGVGIG